MKPKVKPRILGQILGRNVAGPESPSSDSPPPHTCRLGGGGFQPHHSAWPCYGPVHSKSTLRGNLLITYGALLHSNLITQRLQPLIDALMRSQITTKSEMLTTYLRHNQGLAADCSRISNRL